jgi:sec-independent protein translocase protein TatC
MAVFPTLRPTLRTVARSPQGLMSLGQHLAELRRRTLVGALSVAAAGVVAFFFYPWMLSVLRHPYCEAAPGRCQLYVTSPLDGISLRVHVAAYGGLVLASPVLLWQFWRFVTPGLHARERRFALPFVASSVLFFCLGALAAFESFPRALQWLDSVGGPDLHQIYDPVAYVSLIVWLMVVFGVTFQFPVVLVALEAAGVLSASKLAGARRWAIVLIVVGAGVLTPSSDPISMLALALPL